MKRKKIGVIGCGDSGSSIAAILNAHSRIVGYPLFTNVNEKDMVQTKQHAEFMATDISNEEIFEYSNPYAKLKDTESKYFPKEFQSSVPSNSKRAQLRKKRKRKNR